MNDKTDTNDDLKANVRQSPIGQSLSENQLEDGSAICGIMYRQINKTGKFREPLTGYADAFARSEHFGPLKGEEIIRDLYRATYGETMKQTLVRLVNREREIEPTIGEDALRRADSIIDLIGKVPNMPFHRAYDLGAAGMAAEHGITEAGAKRMMTGAFRSREGRELYEAGKEAEKLSHKPERQEEQRNNRKTFTRSKRQRTRD